MAEWYFDVTATGTGSGDTPGNAFTNVRSMFNTITLSSQYGDRVWCRRTNVATYGDANVGAPFGRTGWNAASHPYTLLSGWPKSGDPFYSIRPAAGISAGWDSDVNTIIPDDLFVLWDVGSGSNTGTWQCSSGVIQANLMFASGAVRGPRNPIDYFVMRRNVHWLNFTMNQDHVIPGDLTLTLSWGNLSGNNRAYHVDRLTITNSSVIGAIFGPTAGVNIKELVINCNSVTHIGYVEQPTTLGVATTQIRRVGRISGTKPRISALNSNQFWTGFDRLEIDDYYGEGPLLLINKRRRANFYPASQQAWCNSVPAVNASFIDPGNVEFVGTFNQMNRMGSMAGRYENWADAKAIITVTSGVPAVIRWPILQIGSSQMNVNSSNTPAYVHVLGQRMVNADINVSSGFTWHGNSVTGVGSAWVAVAGFVPTASGSFMADLMMPTINPNPSALEFMYFGNPQVNSA